MGTLNLHYEAAPDPLLDLLRRLMQEELLSPFVLVGGTALALRLGHRISVDIDLFSDNAFDVQPITEMLRDIFSIQALETAQNTVRGEVDGIKLDIMSHCYPAIGTPVTMDGIRMASLEDITAMKLNAIAHRGSKKDFWDYAELLSHFSRDEMLGFFAKKYSNENVWYAEKSLSYFDDAEEEPDPRDLKDRIWNEIKQAVLASNRL